MVYNILNIKMTSQSLSNFPVELQESSSVKFDIVCGHFYVENVISIHGISVL